MGAKAYNNTYTIIVFEAKQIISMYIKQPVRSYLQGLLRTVAIKTGTRTERGNRSRHNIQKPVTKTIAFLFFSCLCILFASCSTIKYATYKPERKIDTTKLKDDLRLLKKILEADHPSLYWYTPKDSLDKYFSETIDGITDSLTETTFRNKVAWYISKINCGHTSVRPSKNFADYNIAFRSPRFPLSIKTWGDSLILLGTLNRKDSLLKRGAIITSIENYSNEQLLDSMFQFISTDGYSNNFKSQAISFNFPVYYNFAFPLKDSFLIKYIDDDSEKQTYVHLYKPAPDTGKKQTQLNISRPSIRQIKQNILLSKRSLVYDSANNLAYMRVATFSGGGLRRFFRKSFKEINEKHVKNLAIDLRENSGGSINMSTLLTRYVKDKRFHLADTAAAVTRSIAYKKYIKPTFPFQWIMTLATQKKADGKYHFRELEKEHYKPLEAHSFHQQVYIIQGGYTFSAAAMFVEQLKGQQNVTVVGEETGGGNYGTSAVHLPEIILPNTGVRVVLPLYRLVFDSTYIKNGRGIQPDIYVPPSSVDLKNGIDPKLQKVKSLIQEKKNAGLQ